MTLTVTQKLMRLSFLPLLVLVSLLAMYTRAENVLVAFESGALDSLLRPAQAIAESDPKHADHPTEPVAAAHDAAPPAPPSTTAPDAARASDDETPLTDEDIKILQQLGDRRREIDKRAEELDQRDALIQASEKRIDAKIAEMQQMRKDLEALLGQAGNQHQQQLKSLVKIYENMKPAQAAKVFEQLDMNVLLAVIHEMKEAKAAPIMAAMDPMKAKAVTTELIKRKDLPKLDSEANQSATPAVQ